VFVTRHLTEVEPMPEWGTVDLHKLEGALGAPSRTLGTEDAYPTFGEKTAILAYSMIKAHAWANGNKRMALISTLLFTALNAKWWDVLPEDARAHVTWIAASDSRCFPEVIAYLTKYFDQKIVPFEESSVARELATELPPELHEGLPGES
jgi:death on curing protein